MHKMYQLQRGWNLEHKLSYKRHIEWHNTGFSELTMIKNWITTSNFDRHSIVNLDIGFFSLFILKKQNGKKKANGNSQYVEEHF